MTLNQISYNILKKIKPVLTDDTNLSIDTVKYDVNTERALILKGLIEGTKHFSIDDVLVQDLGCVELETADAAECCDFSTGCTVLRTKKEIPAEIRITRVGPIIKTRPRFKLVTYEEALMSGNGKFNKNTIFAYPLNDRIYLVSKSQDLPLLEYINIRGVFEDPREVADFTQCDTNTACYSDDDDYPMPQWMETIIRDRLMKVYSVTEQLPVDLANDTKDQSTDAS